MFEKELYEYVSSNFSLSGFPTLPIYFGEAPEATNAPYIVMYVLDSNGDPQTLCDEQFDSGNSFIQWNIYSPSMKGSFFIKQELNKFLTGFRRLTGDSVSYTINRTTHGSSPSAQSLNNGLAVDVLAKTFNYTKVN